MKKIFFKTFFMLAVLFTGVLLVNASSEYYNYRWTNTWITYHEYDCETENSALHTWGASPFSGNENYKIYEYANCNGTMYVINDAIETEEGILAVGYVNDRISAVILLNKTGEILDNFNYSNEFSSQVFFKRIVKSGNYYYVIGNVIGPNGGIGILKVNADGTYVSSKIIAAGSYIDSGELNILSTKDNYYIVNAYYDDNSAYGVYNMVRTNKSFDDATTLIKNEEVIRTLTKDEKNLIKNMTVIANREIEYNFIEEYNDGFLYNSSVYDDGWNGNKIEYIKDGNIKWSKYYENFWIKDAIFTDDKAIMLALKIPESSRVVTKTQASTAQIDPILDFYIIVLDENGEELGREKLSNYTDEDFAFQAEHIRKVGNGFIITGIETNEFAMEGVRNNYSNSAGISSNIEEYRAQILYFQFQYRIETKTDGKGTVLASQSKADEGTNVTFTVTPKKGYKIDKIKVTDSEGKVVIFTDNTFTMPNADVLIEATFVVANPNTKTFISTCAIFFLLVLSLTGMLILRIYRRRIDKIQKTA